MRWTIETGNTRIVTRFLWLPREINGEVRWMERATWRMEYKNYVGGWEDVEWLASPNNKVSHGA